MRSCTQVAAPLFEQAFYAAGTLVFILLIIAIVFLAWPILRLVVADIKRSLGVD